MVSIQFLLSTMGLSLWFALSVPGVVAQSLGDDPAFAASRQATEAFNRQEYRQAESLAREAVAHYPQHLLAHYLLGQIAMAETRWDEAIQAFSTVVSLYPRCFVGQRDLGIALEQAKRLDEAVTAYQTALTILPENDNVQARLAFLHVQAGRQDAALALLKPLAEKGTQVPEVWGVLGRLLYDAKDFPASEKALSRATDLRDDGRLWFNLGAVRLHLDDWKGALPAFERAARHPEMQEQARREIDRIRQRHKDVEPAQKDPEPAQRRTRPAK
jgi:tetratricopeptide (TPR) repeat protein